MNSHYEDGSFKNKFEISNVRSVNLVEATFLFLHNLTYVLFSFDPKAFLSQMVMNILCKIILLVDLK